MLKQMNSGKMGSMSDLSISSRPFAGALRSPKSSVEFIAPQPLALVPAPWHLAHPLPVICLLKKCSVLWNYFVTALQHQRYKFKHS